MASMVNKLSPSSGHQLPEQEEVRQLKRELEVVRMERDIFSRLPQ
jgi:transposase-like protein